MYNGETFEEWIDRVAYQNSAIRKAMLSKKFLPAGRILYGRRLPHMYGKKVTYSNCYVVARPKDNLESIFETAKSMARTYSYGGGCGTSLEFLRPRGSKVNNSAESTSGAVSFMELYSLTTGLIGQAGRRGALMLTLPISHPDIAEFIDVKTDLDKVTFANISIMITDDFMKAVKKDEVWTARFTVEDTGEVITKEFIARELLNKIAINNWGMGEPGFLFWDRVKSYHINDHNPRFEYASTNPCGEKPLIEGGSCLLASINESEFVKNGVFDYESFAKLVADAIRYLDDVLEEGIPFLPLPEQREAVVKYRQLGLGLMGEADMLIKLGIKYGSEEHLDMIDELGIVMSNIALQTSSLLAKERGVYPEFDMESVLQSTYLNTVATEETMEMIKLYGLRNSELLSIAPTGSISTMLGVSGGIEPIFANYYTRESKSFGEFYKVYTPIVEKYMKEHGITDDKDLPEYFVTSATIGARNRIAVQGRWQKYIDSAISSTVNLPNSAEPYQIANIYVEAWKQGLKGITVFRTGCQRTGILTLDGDSKTESEAETEFKSKLINSKYGHCPDCGGIIERVENGCSICMDCGYSGCA